MPKNYSLVIFIIFCLATSCIPIRKQLLMIDNSKKDLKAIQSTDTIIYIKPFLYKIRCGDNLTMSVSNLPFSSSNGFQEIMQTGAKTLETSSNNNVQNSSSQSNNNTGYIVNDSGFVNLPLLGSIKLEGITIEEAESKINRIASKYFNHTITNIQVGFTYTLVLLNNGNTKISPKPRLTLLEVISQSSVPELGNLTKIKIIRRNDKNNGYHIYYVNINDQSIASKPEFYVLPNDIIIVEPYRLKNFNQYFTRNVGLITTFISLPLLFFSILGTYRRL